MHLGEEGPADDIRAGSTSSGSSASTTGSACSTTRTSSPTSSGPASPFTVCPTSNRRIGLVDSVASHPLIRMRDAGVLVTLNSDNAAMFDIDLADEYVNVRDAFGCSLDELEDFSLAAIDASWADDDDQAGDAPRLPRRDGRRCEPRTGDRRATEDRRRRR